MEKPTLNVVSFEKMQEAITLIIRDKAIDDVLAKPQICKSELFRYYGQKRALQWIKDGLLKPVSQNGRGSKSYYDHKKVIELSKKSFYK